MNVPMLPKSFRRVEVLTAGHWIEKEFEELVQGNIFRVIPHENEQVYRAMHPVIISEDGNHHLMVEYVMGEIP